MTALLRERKAGEAMARHLLRVAAALLREWEAVAVKVRRHEWKAVAQTVLLHVAPVHHHLREVVAPRLTKMALLHVVKVRHRERKEVVPRLMKMVLLHVALARLRERKEVDPKSRTKMVLLLREVVDLKLAKTILCQREMVLLLREVVDLRLAKTILCHREMVLLLREVVAPKSRTKMALHLRRMGHRLLREVVAAKGLLRERRGKKTRRECNESAIEWRVIQET